ncbi:MULTISPECIES: hypothetical protein [Hyphobacterium]|uniref:HEPN domain-containing protein n=1 Tax=Hyphobacterium vulgare TaxID=1736751 RepID=A0ABV6ZV23_9PROT
MAELWLEDFDAFIIPSRKEAYGVQAERERHQAASRAVKYFHVSSYYFLGAFIKRDFSATAYFAVEMASAISKLDELIFSAHGRFIVERRLDADAINRREIRPETIERNDAIVRSARAFLSGESVQTVHLHAEIARYVRENCDAARKLSYSEIIGILEQRQAI